MLNLKSYPQALGAGGIRLGRMLERLAAEVPVAIAANAVDVATLARELSIPVLAQHADAHELGARTGWVVAETLKEAGVRGSLLNHSERPVPPTEVERSVRRLRGLGLLSVVCAREDREATELASLAHPDYLAVEPPDLIGGKVSVARARPEVISRSVEAVRRAAPLTRLLVGAGVQDGTDVRRALELGAQGVLVASAVVTSPDPEGVLRDMLAGFRAR